MIHVVIKSLKGTKISDAQFDSILSLYKFFLYDEILCETSPVIQFYAPNSEGVLHNLEDLYFDVDDEPESFDYLRKNNVASTSQLNLMFDIEFLRVKYMETSGKLKQNDSNLKRTAVFKSMNSWGKIFQTFPYFSKNQESTPKPLSDLIERRIIDEDCSVRTDAILNSFLK